MSRYSFSWHNFVLSVLYLSAIPQVLLYYSKPLIKSMPAVISSTPDGLIDFWALMFVILFMIIIPCIIGWLGTQKNLDILMKMKLFGFNIGGICYLIIWLFGLLIFALYLGIELTGLSQL